MKLTLDNEQYDKLQTVLITEIVDMIKVKLMEGGLEGNTLEDLTAHIAMSVSSILDDSTGMEKDGMEVKPYLTFRVGDDELVHCGDNSYTYEKVYGILKNHFHS
jgi:hypothetical protein